MPENNTTDLNEEFVSLRTYVDACINPISAPEHLISTLTTSASKLLEMIEAFETRLLSIRIPPYPPFSEPPKRKRKRTTKNEIKFDRYLREEYERRRRNYYQNSNFQIRVLVRLRREVQRNSVNGILLSPKRLNWVILPTDSGGLSQIREYCNQLLQRRPNSEIEFSRIEHIYSLSPQATYYGINEFDGYLVFYFGDPGLAVLECPIVGNAIYLIHGDWISLSRLTKTDLLQTYASHVSRIIHNNQWREEIQQRLQPWVK